MTDYPVSGLDPFSEAYLADPHPAQEALREAGPVVRLTHTTSGQWRAIRRCMTS